ncbi:PvdJ/PvdD/PvdP-like protein, partial [Pseudomonas sp. MAFF212428]|nr:PvdJ/PvdD/PvdP-like protein [Pseudomonas brassicae]
DLAALKPDELTWRLFDREVGPHRPVYELSMVLDEVWGEFANAGSGTLTGRILDLDRSLSLPEQDNRFVATRQLFPEARERIGLQPALLNWLISDEHRLFHQLWHASRDQWHELPEDKRNALRGLGWQPGTRDLERDARGPKKDRNGSGVDFLFMHRHMLHTARSLQHLPSWSRFPAPQPELERDRPGFARYFDNHDGCAVPPTWLAPGDDEYTQWVSDIKNPETYHANFEVWESQYRDPRYLSRLTLGQLGSEMELGLHDWLHMRWASVPRDPSNGAPVPMARDLDDFSARWYGPDNDFLGDPFSSHVNPVFWLFHGWIDDRIDDWFRAHERFHPGQVVRNRVNDVPWFAPGRWVDVEQPWLGPVTHGCSTTPGLQPGKSVEMDPETMKLALRVIFANTKDKSRFDGLLRRVPQRPWYARHLVVTRRS